MCGSKTPVNPYFTDYMDLLFLFLAFAHEVIYFSLMGMDTLAEVATLSKKFCPPNKGSTLNTKIFTPLGSNSSHEDPFSEEVQNTGKQT